MSRNPTLDPHLERRIRREGIRPDTLPDRTTTPVERPLMATQARSQRLITQELLEDIRETPGHEESEGEALAPEPLPSEPSEPTPTSQEEISNLELRAVLLALSRNNRPQPKRKHRAIREPDPFSGGGPDELRAFLFQCQIYFRASEGEFTKDSEKIFFAISYLRSIALDYFEPFIIELDPLQSLDFLEDWSAFVQHLSNVFGSYSPEDNNEDAIITIPFPHDGRAANYFIRFAKYQNRIRWDDWSLRKVVKDAIPTRISEELRYSQEDLSSFEGYKRAVMRVDDNYWRQVQDDKNKINMACTLQHHLPRFPKPENHRSALTNRPKTLEPPPLSQQRAWNSPSPTQSTEPSSSPGILGPNGHLTAVERNRRLSLGLCLCCGQSGHLARLCPKQASRNPAVPRT